MIRDLSVSDEPSIEVDADVCIVGAGTSGIFLAEQLRRSGVRVVIVEAGDAMARAPEDVDQRCEQRGIRYRGADSGRSFGLGGTSVLWGGQLIPVAPSDVAARNQVGFDAWPLSFAEVSSYFPVVSKELGLGAHGSDDDSAETAVLKRWFPELFELSDEFSLRLSRWLPFAKRNFAQAFSRMLKRDSGVTLWLNAAVVGIESGPASDARVTSVKAKGPNGRTLLVRPKALVIAAGALESTRLVLAFDESTGGALTRTGSPAGRYFADHLSITCGRFLCRDWRRFNHAVSPIFASKGVMRTPRLEVAAKTQSALGLTSAFAHFTFITRGDTGFDVVRSFLRRRQGEQHPLGLSPAMLGRVVSDVSAMAWWRFVHRRLWIPRQADVLLQVDIEQMPNSESRLLLSDDRDSLGRKRLVIDWRITERDIRVIRTVAELTIGAWQRSSLRSAAELQLTLPDEFESFDTLYDVYHPTGTLRMGTSEADSVVDKNLRLWAADNCYVTSTAVFPSAGSANPGLTHLALTARLAETLSGRLNNFDNLVSV